ncbi:hypothetical protein AB4305_31865 [Nocardia sp. 2YAB30]|uniref:hypothetical protein n=1 Tax=Nocardia sp. 2YAB30 TaxID=3233022 RepID=UPI003F9E2D24
MFNSDYSVGVGCDRNGLIIGLHLGEEVRENGNSWLAAEILRIARLAYLKAGVRRRAEMLDNGGSPRIADSMGLPTEAEHNTIEKTEFDADDFGSSGLRASRA